MNGRHYPGILSLVASLLLLSQQGLTDVPAGEALLVEKRCIACHETDRPLIGPPYRAIAARHAAQKEIMVEVLARKIIIGGAGNWGAVPMVPNEHVSEDEALAMARWILALAQSSE